MQTTEAGKHGAAIILIHDGKILLQLRDNKPDISNPNMWGLPGGGIEDGETPDEAMRRECQEEIGIIPKEVTYIGHVENIKFRFFAHLTDKEVEQLVLGEGQEIRFFTPQEVLNMHTTPKLTQLFKEHFVGILKLVSNEKITHEDLGLEA